MSMAKKVVKKRLHTTQDKFFAKMSFWLGVFSFIPLFNYGLSLAAIYFGIKALNLIASHPKQFSGKWMAIVGLVLGGVFFVGSIVATVFFLIKRFTCANLPEFG